LKILFNFLLVDLEQDGLALSSSISYCYFFLVSYIVLNIKLKIENLYLFIKDFIFLGINCLISFLIVHLVLKIIHLNNFIQSPFVIIFIVILYLFNSILIKHNSIDMLKRVRSNFNFFQRFRNG